jgi:chromosome segregation ATPase
MKEELQLALRALEKNLKDIQAANETVKAVRKQAADDIQAAGDVIQRINQEIDIIDSHFNNWLGNFDSTTKGTFQDFEFKAKESIKKLTGLNDELKSHVDSNLQSMSESNRLLFQKYEATWTKHNQELDRAYLKLESMQQGFDSMKRQIDQVDFPKKLEGIENSIADLEERLGNQEKQLSESTNSQSMNFTVLIVLGGVIILIQLISMFWK